MNPCKLLIISCREKLQQLNVTVHLNEMVHLAAYEFYFSFEGNECYFIFTSDKVTFDIIL